MSRQRAILDYNTGMRDAREEGIKEGAIKIAKNMLKKGIDIDTIIEVTGLTKEEIEEIKNK